MELYGRKYKSTELRRRIGNMDQIAGIRCVTLEDGNERPGRAALVHSGSGLAFTVLLDRGMDLSQVSFNGRSIGYRSPTGDVAPQYYEPEGTRWLRSFYGGLLTTCGLGNVGTAQEDSGVTGVGIHGRLSNIPARDLKITQEWRDNDYVLSISGVLRETRVFGENLKVERTISTQLGEKRIWLEDTITNEGFQTTPYSLLYHCNIGWPVMDEGSEIIAPSRHIAVFRDDLGKDEMERWNIFTEPQRDKVEEVFYHDMANDRGGDVTVAAINNRFSEGEGLGVAITYNQDALPRFTQWKQEGEQIYVLGLEPCNCGVQGTAVDEAARLQRQLKPGKQMQVRLCFSVISTEEEVAALRRKAGGKKTKIAEDYRTFVPKP